MCFFFWPRTWEKDSRAKWIMTKVEFFLFGRKTDEGFQTRSHQVLPWFCQRTFHGSHEEVMITINFDQNDVYIPVILYDVLYIYIGKQCHVYSLCCVRTCWMFPWFWGGFLGWNIIKLVGLESRIHRWGTFIDWNWTFAWFNLYPTWFFVGSK